jgi:hypothetical protein
VAVGSLRAAGPQPARNDADMYAYIVSIKRGPKASEIPLLKE